MAMSRADLRALPKVELHNHLEGMIRLSTIVDLCKQFKVDVPGVDPSRPDDVKPYHDKFLNDKKVENIEVFFNKFWEIQSLLRTEEVIERISFEACEDSFNDGVKLIEYRYSPSFIGRSHYSDHSHLTYENVLNAIKAGIARAQRKYDIAVGLLCIFDRSQPMEDEVAVFNFLMDHRDDFVGIDIANDEVFPCQPYAHWFQAAKAAGLGLTCHAGDDQKNSIFDSSP
jgi:adenosine deaminase